MRLAIYVPKAQAELWTPDATDLSFDAFQREVIDLAGGLTLTSAIAKSSGGMAHWTATNETPVFIVEALLRIPDTDTYRKAWELFRSYAHQLIAQGEESVLIVQDNEPTFITA